MDSKKLSEGGNDFRRVPDYNEFSCKLNVLGKHIEKLESSILSTRNCFDFMLNEITTNNEKIIRDISWNQKRIDLLKEISNKLCIYMDERHDCYREYLSIYDLSNNVNNLNLNKNKSDD